VPNKPICFFEEDLLLFSAASGDRNPLHLSPEYARGTPYGERVVFDVLGAIACLGRIQWPEDTVIETLQVEFFRPMFLGVPYEVWPSSADGVLTVRLYDGGTTVLAVAATYRGGAALCGEVTQEARIARLVPVPREERITIPGLGCSAPYACDAAALKALCCRWDVLAPPFIVAALCCSSFVVGMELPGASALSSKVTLRFERPPRLTVQMQYRAGVRALDHRIHQGHIEFSIFTEQIRTVSGECRLFFGSALPAIPIKRN
jgi:hypothetical protein